MGVGLCNETLTFHKSRIFKYMLPYVAIIIRTAFRTISFLNREMMFCHKENETDSLNFDGNRLG